MHAPLPQTSRLALSADGVIEGYASLFGEIDQARDMMMPGAFTQTLAQRGLRKIPMLFQHDPAEPVGVWLELVEDWRGLRARGRLIPDVKRANELLALMRAGAIDGLSIGYRTVRSAIDPRTRVRRLHQVDLWEVSVVTFPLLQGARIDAIKSSLPSRRREEAERAWQLACHGMGGAAEAPAQLKRRGSAAMVSLRSRADRKKAFGSVALRR